MATLIERTIGAARLDPGTYEEVEADVGAFGQAMTVVVVAAIAGGIGSAGEGGPGLIGGLVGSLIGWFVWALTVFVVGTRILPHPGTQADMGQLLRTTGFAAAPGIARVLGIVPGIGGVVMAVTALWQLAAMVVAVRTALDYESTGRAVAVCVLGFIAQVVVFVVVIGALGAMAGATGY
jgi:hypothetical protein